jgi:predicted metalloendopeptidase
MIMRRIGLCCAATLLLAGSVTERGWAAAAAQPLVSGLDVAYIDPSVRAQDDPYVRWNGKWLTNFEIPADKGNYDSFTYIDDKIQEQLRGIVEGLAQAPQASGSEAKKIADLYASFLDEARLEQIGVQPVLAQFAKIDALTSKDEVPALIARLNRTDINAPYDLSIDPDQKDSTRYAVTFGQSGLGLPDRDYYLKDDAKLKAIRDQYLEHIEKLFALAGEANAHESAAEILKFETAMAALQWTRVENRDPQKTYNKLALADLAQLMPGYAWDRYLQASGIVGKVDYVIISQPSYFTGLAKLIADTPLPVLKTYFKWHVLTASAPYLSKDFVAARFAFAGTVLNGIPQNQPRWRRGLRLVDRAMGEALGHLYVDQYFPPENKARMQKLVAGLLEAYRRDIKTLDWMGPQTKVGAEAKLAKLVTKIGYPSKWRDYSNLEIVRDDLLGNVLRADEFEYRRNIDKLGRPIDRSEWDMSPQTVNAYYNPLMNEIVFPAAILQPPFFDAAADDAVNYGGIVAVIGHEVSHGFDDEGSQYDADGNLHDWFTKEDHERFAAKTKALVAQYDAYEPVPGFHVNGELTLGENIADNSGLTLAYKAYQQSLGGKPAPVIGGYTGDQRFFLGWVQAWRGKVREAEEIQRIKTDPHSPDAVRGDAPLKNEPAFYGTFHVKPGDHMYLAPDQRVIIW